MNSKEALKLIWNEVDLKSYECNGSTIGFLNLLELIEDDIDWLETLEIKNKDLEHELDREEILIGKIIKERDKYEKAIEILERFNFKIFTVKNNNNETAFKIYTDSLLDTQEITQQEYELLKEVLDYDREK